MLMRFQKRGHWCANTFSVDSVSVYTVYRPAYTHNYTQAGSALKDKEDDAAIEYDVREA